MKKKNVVVGSMGLLITGDIASDVSFSLESDIIGNILCDDCDIVIRKGAKVTGNVKARNVTVENAVVIGDITAKNMITLCDKAVVFGDIEFSKIVIDAGACLNGTCKVNKEEPQQSSLEDCNGDAGNDE